MNYCPPFCYIARLLVRVHFCCFLSCKTSTNQILTFPLKHPFSCTCAICTCYKKMGKMWTLNCEMHSQPHLSCSLRLGAHLADYVQMTGKVHFQADVPLWINNAHVSRCRVETKREKHLCKTKNKTIVLGFAVELGTVWGTTNYGRAPLLWIHFCSVRLVQLI